MKFEGLFFLGLAALIVLLVYVVMNHGTPEAPKVNHTRYMGHEYIVFHIGAYSYSHVHNPDCTHESH